jgi:hypothetical protein
MIFPASGGGSLGVGAIVEVGVGATVGEAVADADGSSDWVGRTVLEGRAVDGVPEHAATDASRTTSATALARSA